MATRAAKATRTKGKPAKAAADAIARLGHALSDPTRLAILDRLRNGEECVCNLVDLIGGGQSRLSFHLRTLKEAGLVQDRRDGRWVHYSLSPAALTLLHGFVADLEKCCSLPAKGGSCC